MSSDQVNAYSEKEFNKLLYTIKIHHDEFIESLVCSPYESELMYFHYFVPTDGLLVFRDLVESSGLELLPFKCDSNTENGFICSSLILKMSRRSLNLWKLKMHKYTTACKKAGVWNKDWAKVQRIKIKNPNRLISTILYIQSSEGSVKPFDSSYRHHRYWNSNHDVKPVLDCNSKYYFKKKFIFKIFKDYELEERKLVIDYI